MSIFFKLGEIRVHPEAAKAVGETEIHKALDRHQNLDHGGIDEPFKKHNAETMLSGEGTIFSAYKINGQILIIKTAISKTGSVFEAAPGDKPQRQDREATMVMLHKHLKLSEWGSREKNPPKRNPRTGTVQQIAVGVSNRPNVVDLSDLDNLLLSNPDCQNQDIQVCTHDDIRKCMERVAKRGRSHG
jgi:hypothetical protein